MVIVRQPNHSWLRRGNRRDVLTRIVLERLIPRSGGGFREHAQRNVACLESVPATQAVRKTAPNWVTSTALTLCELHTVQRRLELKGRAMHGSQPRQSNGGELTLSS